MLAGDRRQINLVNNFTGNGVVKSFYVPYFCPECDEEKVLLVEATDMGPPPHEPPTCRCDECDLVMDFDDMPDSYFAFLSNQRKVPEPDKVNGAMRDLGRGSEPDPSRSGKVRSRASQPNLSSGSKPSVPSLPSIQRTSSPAPPMANHPSGARGFATPPPSRPQLGSKPPTGPTSRPNPGAPMGYPAQMGPMGHPAPMQQHPGHPGQAGQPHQMALGHPGQMNPMSGMGHPHHHSGPNNMLPPSSYGYGGQGTASSASPPKSNALVLVLIIILVAAIGVLAYLVITK